MARVPQGEVQAVDPPFGIESGDAAFVPAEIPGSDHLPRLIRYPCSQFGGSEFCVHDATQNSRICTIVDRPKFDRARRITADPARPNPGTRSRSVTF
jgi:hypothetical protein